MFRNLPKLFYFLMLSTLLFSCVGKKEILYFQDAEKYDVTDIIYKEYTIQPNDILSVTISAAVPEAAIPYNMNQNVGAMVNTANIDVLKLQGYLVNSEGYI